MEAEYLGNQGINNPLDTLEKIISLKHWSYSRENEDELMKFARSPSTVAIVLRSVIL